MGFHYVLASLKVRKNEYFVLSKTKNRSAHSAGSIDVIATGISCVQTSMDKLFASILLGLDPAMTGIFITYVT